MIILHNYVLLKVSLSTFILIKVQKFFFLKSWFTSQPMILLSWKMEELQTLQLHMEYIIDFEFVKLNNFETQVVYSFRAPKQIYTFI